MRANISFFLVTRSHLRISHCNKYLNDKKIVKQKTSIQKRLDCSNMAAEWTKWKQNFMVWMIATGKMEKSKKNKMATFIWLVGEQGAVIYNTLFPNDGTQNSMLGEVRVG